MIILRIRYVLFHEFALGFYYHFNHRSIQLTRQVEQLKRVDNRGRELKRVDKSRKERMRGRLKRREKERFRQNNVSGE